MITANLFFNKTPTWDSYRVLVLLPAMAKRLIPEQGYDEKSLPLKAYVNHGRWIVKCECGGGEKAWEEGWVMCQSCFNATLGHRYRRVIFPKPRSRIEQLLTVRPEPNRNWRPGETLADLERENSEHRAELLEVR